MQCLEQRQLNLILFRKTHRSAMLSFPHLTANSKLKRRSAVMSSTSMDLGPPDLSIPIASSRHCKHLPRMTPAFGTGLVIPDLWQQEAVRALQQGKDVVVQAPTGSGKTYIFELLYPNLKTQAVFTVPTRAL